jgi:hypothetical protein
MTLAAGRAQRYATGLGESIFKGWIRVMIKVFAFAAAMLLFASASFADPPHHRHHHRAHHHHPHHPHHP